MVKTTNSGLRGSRKVSAAQAKSRLAEYLRSVENGEAVIITRHGKPVAALVGLDHLALGRRNETRLGAGLASLAGGWKGSDALAAAMKTIRRTKPRRPTTLD